MITWKTTLLAAAASFALAGAAAAQESPIKEPAEPAAPEDYVQEDDGGIDISFNVGAATDYVFRGVSQTDEGAQVFGGVDLTAPGGFYAGVWASNVDFDGFGDDDTNVEVDFYAGVKPEVGGFVLDFAGIFYTYYNQPDNAAELSYFEFKAAASRAIGPATLGAALYYSPEFTGETGNALYSEINGAYTLNDRVSFSAALGHQSIDDTDGDYTTGNIGATFVVTPNVGVDLRYHATDEEEFGDVYEDRVVASIKATF